MSERDPQFQLYDVTAQKINDIHATHRHRTDLSEIERADLADGFTFGEGIEPVIPFADQISSFAADEAVISLVTYDSDSLLTIGLKLQKAGKPYARDKDKPGIAEFMAVDEAVLGHHNIYLQPDGPAILAHAFYPGTRQIRSTRLPGLLKQGGAEVVSLQRAQAVLDFLGKLTVDDPRFIF